MRTSKASLVGAATRLLRLSIATRLFRPSTAARLLCLTVSAGLLGLPGVASATVVHEVSPGESLTSVAATDGLTVEELAATNGLPPTAELIAGSQLVIPPQRLAPGEASVGETSGEGAAPPSAPISAPQLYEVQPGDTLTAIAERFGSTVEQLAAANGLDPSGLLLAGSTLNLEGIATESPATSSAATSQPVGEAAEGSPSEPPYPTPEAVSPEDVAAIAEENGVPRSLAEAVADQESGFNNAFTSSADARGEMQITPGTWTWIDEALAGQTLQPASASDNVRGGVLLLHSLLDATGGNEQLAIAGYYQGLPSVLQNGEYGETQHYVEDVQALQGRFGG